MTQTSIIRTKHNNVVLYTIALHRVGLCCCRLWKMWTVVWYPFHINDKSQYFVKHINMRTVHNNLLTFISKVIISFVIFPRKWLYNLSKYDVPLFDLRHLSHCRAKRSAIWPFTAKFIFLGSQSRSLWCPFQHLDERCTCTLLLSRIHWEW